MVHLLTKVTIRNIESNMEMSYTIVSESEADLASRKISSTSPIGKGLLGKKVGDIAEIHTPGGVINFEVIEISAL